MVKRRGKKEKEINDLVLAMPELSRAKTSALQVRLIVLILFYLFEQLRLHFNSQKRSTDR